MRNVKEYLLSLGDFVIDNQYLDKYVSIVVKNLETSKEVFKHQLHHIVPVSYYKHRGTKVNNDSINIVALTPSEHILAHYYLSLCCCSEADRCSNLEAVKYCFNHPNLDIDSIMRNTSILIDYNEVCNKINIHKSLSYKGRKHITRSGVDKVVKQEELASYLSDGWSLGRSDKTRASISAGSFGKKGAFLGKHHSEQARRAIGVKHSGGVYVHKEGIVKHIKHEDLDKYLSLGYVCGNPQARKPGMIWITNGEVNKLIWPSQISDFPEFHRGRTIHKNK